MTNLRGRLRMATAAEHERLEARLDILSRVASRAGRRALIESFYSLHAGAEAAMEPHLEGVAGLCVKTRRRTPHLLADLAALQGERRPPARIEGCDSRGAALGWMYVLEGSTLGGKVIGARLGERGESTEGLSFLDPYGAEGGARWRAFLEVMEREGEDPLIAAAAEAGALAAFRQAGDALCGADACA